ncbi:hypothetical protein D9C73_024457 [Collichthys lucidus]|uniref:Uncharacterized protein n=1 Tax=Collichthys lucidus TaxID=240159 RepID=A0A4U5VPC1_COLLU|nr:hypothetical protein D9C73_024457 [Collichthys lucidus]
MAKYYTTEEALAAITDPMDHESDASVTSESDTDTAEEDQDFLPGADSSDSSSADSTDGGEADIPAPADELWRSRNGDIQWAPTNARTLQYQPPGTGNTPGPTRYAVSRVGELDLKSELRALKGSYEEICNSSFDYIAVMEEEDASGFAEDVADVRKRLQECQTKYQDTEMKMKKTLWSRFASALESRVEALKEFVRDWDRYVPEKDVDVMQACLKDYKEKRRMTIVELNNYMRRGKRSVHGALGVLVSGEDNEGDVDSEGMTTADKPNGPSDGGVDSGTAHDVDVQVQARSPTQSLQRPAVHLVVMWTSLIEHKEREPRWGLPQHHHRVIHHSGPRVQPLNPASLVHRGSSGECTLRYQTMLEPDEACLSPLRG